jgi:protease-4
VGEVADGRIFTADQAVSLNLVDRMGYLDDAVKQMREELGLREARVVAYYRPGSYRGTIYSVFPETPDRNFNVIAINAGSLMEGSGVRFMYLWKP